MLFVLHLFAHMPVSYICDLTHRHPLSKSLPLFRIQFSLVAQLCPTLCDPMDCSTPGLSVHHQLPELSQTHVHLVSDAIQSSHPLSSQASLSQHQALFQ